MALSGLTDLLSGGARLSPVTSPAGLVADDMVDELDHSQGPVPISSFAMTADGDAAVPTRDSANGRVDTGWTTQVGGGISASYGVNSSVVFPSLGADGAGDERAGRRYMKRLEALHNTRIAHVAQTDPHRAGGLLADLESMKSGYEDMLASGEWSSPLEAAYAVGVAGATFNGYGNLSRNTSYLKRFASTRGVKVAEAGRELGYHQDAFAKAFLTAAGFTSKVTPDSSVYEAISNDFSDLLGGVMQIEDKYNWQFNTRAYEDAVRRAGEAAGTLFASGMQLRDVGGTDSALYALMSGGHLGPGGDNGDLSTNRLARLVALRRRDYARFGSIGENGQPDAKAPGINAALASAPFDHRVRSVRAGSDPNDFSDTSALKDSIVNVFNEYSLGSGNVDPRDMDRMAYGMIAAMGNPGVTKVDIADVARSVASGLPPDRAKAVAAWVRSAVADTPETRAVMESCVAPFVSQIMAQTGLGASDPTVRSLSARLYQVAGRRMQDMSLAAAADGSPVNEADLVAAVQAEFKEFNSRLAEIVAQKQALITAQAQAREAAKE